MKVKELIEKLKEFDREREVTISTEYSYEPIKVEYVEYSPKNGTIDIS